MTPAEVLSKARDVLAERGWHQRFLEDPDTGAVCASGAIRIVVWGKPTLRGATALEAALVDQVEDLFCEAVGAGAVWAFNDDTRTTYEDVVTGLKRAEELASERALPENSPQSAGRSDESALSSRGEAPPLSAEVGTEVTS